MTADPFEDYTATDPDATGEPEVLGTLGDGLYETDTTAAPASAAAALAEAEARRAAAEQELADARQRLAEAEAREHNSRNADAVEAAVDAPRHRVPDHAPKPQDHKRPATDEARSREARGGTIVLEMFGETFTVDQAALMDSWDFQMGVVAQNPLQMVKGLLGTDRAFVWFSIKARAEGMSPLTAANTILELWREATGAASLGN